MTIVSCPVVSCRFSLMAFTLHLGDMGSEKEVAIIDGSNEYQSNSAVSTVILNQ